MTDHTEQTAVASRDDGSIAPRLLGAFLARYPSAHSRRSMAQALERAASCAGRGQTAAATPWWRFGNEEVAAIRATLIERGVAPATVNLTLAAVRGVLRTSWRMGLMTADEVARATDVPAWRAQRLPKGRMIPADELGLLFRAAAASEPLALARRDAAMLAVLLGCGLRAAEVTALTVDQYDARTGEVRVIRGKGAKDRLTYLAEPGRRAVGRWLEVRGPSSGALFCAIRLAGAPLVGGSMPHLSSKGLYYRVRALVRRASLCHASPHDFRRTFISMLLDGGHDISTVQQLAGHSSVITTQRYDRRPEDAKRRAAFAVHIPYEEED